MPSCDDRCSCNIQAGPGIIVTGSGTLSNPYVVTSGLDLSQALRVNDTTTVNLTLTGSGTNTDPFTLRADATMALTQLSDVVDAAGPAVGDVPVWIGTGTAAHWEFRPPPANPAGSVNVGSGITGDGTVGAPISVDVIGTTAGGPNTGLEVYVDVDGNLRAVAPVAQAVDWSSIQNKPTAFNPITHSHSASQITDPNNLSVGNSAKVGGKQIFVQSSAPTSGMVANDLWFW